MQYLHVGSACHLLAGARYTGKDDQGIDRSGWLPGCLSYLGRPPRHPSLQGEPSPANESLARAADYSATDHESAASESTRHRNWPHDACESVEMNARNPPSIPTPMQGTCGQAFHGPDGLNTGNYPESGGCDVIAFLPSRHLPPENARICLPFSFSLPFSPRRSPPRNSYVVTRSRPYPFQADAMSSHPYPKAQKRRRSAAPASSKSQTLTARRANAAGRSARRPWIPGSRSKRSGRPVRLRRSRRRYCRRRPAR